MTFLNKQPALEHNQQTRLNKSVFEKCLLSTMKKLDNKLRKKKKRKYISNIFLDYKRHPLNNFPKLE